MQNAPRRINLTRVKIAFTLYRILYLRLFPPFRCLQFGDRGNNYHCAEQRQNQQN